MQVIMLFALVLFTFWDFYVLGVRPLDLAGFMLVFIPTVVFGLKTTSFLRNKYGFLLILATLLLLYCVAGITASSDNVKTAVGIMSGFGVFLIFYSIPLEYLSLIKTINWLIIFHSVFLIFQLLIFYAGGVILDYHAWYGNEFRVGGVIFRPAGLYLEPAGFSLSLMMLLFLKLYTENRIDKYLFFGLISILLSLSFWGLVTSIVIILFQIFRSNSRPLLFLIPIIGIFIIMFPGTQERLASYEVVELIVFRTENILAGGDLSAIDRYSSLSDQFENLSLRTLFGYGIASGVGGNALSNLLYIFGFVGLLSFISLLFALARSGDRLFYLTCVLIMLTAATNLITFYLWWAWLGIMTTAKPGKRMLLSFVRGGRRATAASLIS
jgi:hypothetical protein